MMPTLSSCAPQIALSGNPIFQRASYSDGGSWALFYLGSDLQAFSFLCISPYGKKSRCVTELEQQKSQLTLSQGGEGCNITPIPHRPGEGLNQIPQISLSDCLPFGMEIARRAGGLAWNLGPLPDCDSKQILGLLFLVFISRPSGPQYLPL